MVRSIRDDVSDSNLDLDSDKLMCLGPSESIVKNGRLISVCILEHSSINTVQYSI